MKRSKSGLLSSFLENEDSIEDEDMELLLKTLEQSGDIVINQLDNVKTIIKENSQYLNKLILEENTRYIQYIKDISIR
jgi:hypothetical protein